MFVSRYKDTYDTVLFALSILFAVLIGKKTVSLTLLDLIILTIWIYELLLLFSSINKITTFPYFKMHTVTVLYYFVLQLSLRKYRIRYLLFIESLFCSLLALIGIVSFSLFENRIHSGGFNDLYDFRAIFLPLGNLTNVWVHLLIAFGGIISLAVCYATSKQKIILFIAMLPVLFGILISFSRGAYLASVFILSAFLIGLFVIKTVWWKKIAIIVSVLVAIFLMLFPYITEIQHTLEMNKSTSQQRSIEGRINAGQVTCEILKQYPVTGVGSGNYSLAANEYLYENDPTTYTNIVSGIVFQLFSEKGLTGACLWLIFLIAILLTVFSNRENKGGIIVLIFIFALLVKELTFSVLLENTGLQLIVATWLAVIQNNMKKKYILNINTSFASRTMRWFPSVIWVAVFIAGCFIQRDIKYNEKCIQAIEAKDLKSAESFINHTSKTAPYLVNRSSVYLKQFQQTGNDFYLDLAEENLKQAIRKNPKDFQLQHDLAIVLNKKGNTDESFDILNRLTNRFPKNPLYHVSLSQMFCSKQNIRKATDHLVQAILLSPGLLNSPAYINSVTCNEVPDSMIHAMLKYEVNQKNNRHNDPLLLARHARILLHLGDTLLSKSYLEKVTSQMPNLPRPWCYLGIIAFENKDSLTGQKYLKASLTIDPMDKTARDCWEKYTGERLQPVYSNKESGLDALKTVYYTKFQKWYRVLPVRMNIYL